MEFESRTTQRAPVRNRPSLSLEWKRIRRDSRTYDWCDRRSARKRLVRFRPRLFFCRPKGDLDSIGELAGGFRWDDGGADWLHAARRSSVKLNSVISSEARNLSSLGVAGQLARRVAEKLKLRQDVFLAELELDPVYAAMKAAKEARRYEPLPRFPSVERDFSLLLADGAKFSDATKTIQSLGIKEISAIEATDLFRD